jgi:trans-aconitate methyltransferase
LEFRNTYEDEQRAEAYAALEFPGTYHLAFRDLPLLLQTHVHGRRALDFGCGAGRSTRFLADQGFETTGIDISGQMIRRARERDPRGTYLHIRDGDFSALAPRGFDLVFSAFAFDNIPGREHRAGLVQGLVSLLAPGAALVLLVSAPELYTREWLSFTTQEFPTNAAARSGETVWIVMKDGDDRRPIHDMIWFDEDYHALLGSAGLEVITTHRPLGTADEPYEWVSERDVSPWAIHVARQAG